MKKLYSRKFLKKKEGLSAVAVAFEQEEWVYSGGWSGNVEIVSGHARVGIDFSAFTVKEVVESIEKMKVLIDSMQAGLNWMEEHKEAAIADIEKKDKERKEEKKKFNKRMDSIVRDLDLADGDDAS